MRWLLAGMVVIVSVSTIAAQPSSKTKDPLKSADDAPKIAGKTFDQWVKELSTRDPSKRETAIRAVCSFEPATSIKALPNLIAELRKHQPSSPLDLSVRCQLCLAIAEMYSLGEKIETKTTAEVVPMLRFLLRDTQAIVRFRAATALSAIGPEASAATNDMMLMLREPISWEMRQTAAVTLGSLAGGSPTGPPVPVLKGLYSLLNDPASQVRQAAVQSLSVLGPPAGEKALVDNYVNALLPVALKDPEPGLQIWARVAIIGATNDFSQTNLGPIVKMASHIDPSVRMSAMQALGTIGPKAKASVGAMLTGLTDSETSVQMSAMWALGRMEASAAVALPTLEKMAADINSPDYLKKAAKDAADKIKGR